VTVPCQLFAFTPRQRRLVCAVFTSQEALSPVSCCATAYIPPFLKPPLPLPRGSSLNFFCFLPFFSSRAYTLPGLVSFHVTSLSLLVCDSTDFVIKSLILGGPVIASWRIANLSLLSIFPKLALLLSPFPKPEWQNRLRSSSEAVFSVLSLIHEKVPRSLVSSCPAESVLRVFSFENIPPSK